MKSTGITNECGEGLLCQGLSLDEVQVQINENNVCLIFVDRESKTGREVIDASATRSNINVTNDNDSVRCECELQAPQLTNDIRDLI